MKANLVFNLPDDAFYHLQAVKAMEWYLFACQLDERLRARLKYADLSAEQRAAYEQCRDWIVSLLDEHGLRVHENNN